MFTIRLEYRGPSAYRSGFTCESYAVYTIDTPETKGVTQLLMYNENKEPIEFHLDALQKAYVMNERGHTVDVILGTSAPMENKVA